MKKTIILTVLLLICSLIADQLQISNATSGSMMQKSYSASFISKTNELIEIPNEQLLDANLLDLISLSDDVRTIEHVENKVLYKKVKGTVYHAVEAQCDNTPLITADNSKIDTSIVNELRWVALSRDLLNRKYRDKDGRVHIWKGKIKLGDTIWIDYDKKELWKVTHPNYNPKDSLLVKRQDRKYENLKAKYELVKGYWIVHDVMGTKYTRRDRNGKLILDKNGKTQTVYIRNAIDFLPDGIMEVWDRGLIISKRNVKKITLPVLAAN
jgi:aspartate carbamoyltransferase regulatory subunit